MVDRHKAYNMGYIVRKKYLNFVFKKIRLGFKSKRQYNTVSELYRTLFRCAEVAETCLFPTECANLALKKNERKTIYLFIENIVCEILSVNFRISSQRSRQ